MKNIQIIDGAENCVYDIFAASEEEFAMIFPNGTNVGFIDEIYRNKIVDTQTLDRIFERIWLRPVNKSEVNGINGTLFYDMNYKKIYYPSRRDEEAVNPDGSRLR